MAQSVEHSDPVRAYDTHPLLGQNLVTSANHERIGKKFKASDRTLVWANVIILTEPENFVDLRAHLSYDGPHVSCTPTQLQNDSKVMVYRSWFKPKEAE